MPYSINYNKYPPVIHYMGQEYIGGYLKEPITGDIPDLVSYEYNTDSGGTSRLSNYVIPEGATDDNYYLDLLALWFRGTNKYTSTTTVWIDTNQNKLAYTWTSQSGSSRQYFNIYYIEDPSKLVTISDWTVYDNDDWYEFTLPNGIYVSNCILDFRNVITGGWSTPNSYSQETGAPVIKTQVGNKLRIKFPIGSNVVSVECRLLYLSK